MFPTETCGSESVLATPLSIYPTPIIQDESNNMVTNDEILTPSVSQQQVILRGPSIVTPSVTIMVPTTDLIVTDPITTMKECFLSYYTQQVKSQDIEALTSIGFAILVNPLYDDLRKMLNQHGGDILEAFTNISNLKQ